MESIEVKVVGTSPLLMRSTHGMSATPKEGLNSKGDNVVGREEAEIGAYRDENGGLVFPSIAFSRSLWDAASGVKIGKRTARTLLAGLIQREEFVRVVDPDSGEQLRDFEVDTRFVRVPRGGPRVPRSRARIDRWAMPLLLDYDEELLHPKALVELLSKAGQLIGIGDYRPSTGGGSFGRFVVEL